ncbi:superoxide dismutase family protein [Variovorax sp. NFACC27]|uniref:Superoxide dismutase [Cu-Zn] n=1 Tax=Variovorax gossypii TaxID=1679495 RepID=A0A431TE86_9BURK|nr:superoxide dismutase family protein [Variovorax gossypii]MDP9606625.1 Cu-Zn family superoxide dismutase [Variovorax paradoxus]SEF24921.1 superoxide dismutase, Cu-Zn family [Variovorax sp. NFACC28]SEG31823.1 superoxide dismutase, Cu-Zn family [Variovorax sp. NFACC29]SFC39900.1 superoxide dismutase, Cu-Zn family [Variovorax sp. NFACC26]SFF89855.1 superoxide dismutase, Cu-Zn family [Variovorax sp. NFACC27]
MNQSRLIATGAALLASALLAACGSMGGKPSTAVELVPTAAITPNPTRGTVTFTALDHGVRVAGEVRGLVPGSEHGFHIHEKGDCGDNGNASGGHFNPTGGTHGKFGAPGSHAGELPSLVADAKGVARFSVEDHSISLTPGAANSVIGRALVVHRDPDDFTTQPAGNSGPRIACSVIAKP